MGMGKNDKPGRPPEITVLPYGPGHPQYEDPNSLQKTTAYAKGVMTGAASRGLGEELENTTSRPPSKDGTSTKTAPPVDQNIREDPSAIIRQRSRDLLNIPALRNLTPEQLGSLYLTNFGSDLSEEDWQKTLANLKEGRLQLVQ